MRGHTADDAFGRALLDHLERGVPGHHVLERDDGFVDVMPAAVYFGDMKVWTIAEASALDHVGGRVLDVGAGAGRATLELQRRGVDVTALDVSPGAVEVCRRRGVGTTFTGTVDDLAAADPEPFDTFVYFGNNLGLMGSPDGAREMFGTLERIGTPDAVVVGTMLDPYRTDDPAHLGFHERNRRAGRMAGRVTLRIRYRELTGPWFELLWVSADELGELLEPLGWAIRERWDQPPFYSVVLGRR